MEEKESSMSGFDRFLTDVLNHTKDTAFDEHGMNSKWPEVMRFPSYMLQPLRLYSLFAVAIVKNHRGPEARQELLIK